MNYKERYNAALERARELSKTITGANYEYIFPELKVAEDEKVRKALIELVKYAKGNCLELLDKPFNVVSMDAMLAWLEKQGFNKEQTNLSCFTFDDVLALQCCMETVKKVQEDKELYEKLNDLHSKVYDACQLEKQGEQKEIWGPNAAQLIVIKDLIEDKNTSKVNKVILRGMLGDVEQLINSRKREIDDAYLQGICDAKQAIEKQGEKMLNSDDVIEWIDEHVPTKFEDMQNYVNQFKKDFGL